MSKNILLVLILVSSVVGGFAAADCYECPICPEKERCDKTCVDESQVAYEKAGSDYQAALPQLKGIAAKYPCAPAREEKKE
jgi:hypothetical protein